MEARKIIITGGATRIGAAIAKELSGPNIEIIIHYNKSKSKAKKLKRKLQKYGTIVNLEFCKVLLLASEYRNGKAALCSSSYQLSYVKPSISSLSNQICDYFLEMNEDELKQEDVLYVEQILYVVGIIHTRVFQEQDFSSFIQKHVQVGAKLLRCSMLEKRLCAMNYISRLCNTVDIHNNNMDNRATLASTADDYRYTNGKDVVGVRWHYFDSKNMLDCLEQ